jgi:hypothetical protein
MLGELLAGVEAKHGDVHPVAPMYDLGDNGTRLDDYFAGGIGDQRMGHNGIILPPAMKRPRRCRRRGHAEFGNEKRPAQHLGGHPNGSGPAELHTIEAHDLVSADRRKRPLPKPLTLLH